MYKWPRYGWCQGKIIKCNPDPTLKIGKLMVNFIAYYPCDKTYPEHVLSLQNYNTTADHDSPWFIPQHTAGQNLVGIWPRMVPG